MQKSISTWTLKSQKSGSLYKDPSSYATPPRRRLSVYWHETVDAEEVVSLDKTQLDRQEVCSIFIVCEIVGTCLIKHLSLLPAVHHASSTSEVTTMVLVLLF